MRAYASRRGGHVGERATVRTSTDSIVTCGVRIGFAEGVCDGSNDDDDVFESIAGDVCATGRGGTLSEASRHLAADW
jgi:hypothetical protein